MKFDTRSFIAFVLLSIAVQGRDSDLEESVLTSGVEGDDAEFWERFLGYYVS